MKIGYTTGVFDLFHVGHLNIIQTAKKQCDFLIVGVSTDELVALEKKVSTTIPFQDRIKIVEAIKWVDKVVAQTSYNKMDAWKSYNFSKIYVGDDWKYTARWLELENQFKDVGVEVVYLPYTKHVSSTILRSKLF